MPAPKGNKYATGRPKGKPNRATTEFKDAVKNLVDFATPQMVEWLSQVSREDPYKALEMVYKFAQFGFPLLARSEHAMDANTAKTIAKLTWLASDTKKG